METASLSASIDNASLQDAALRSPIELLRFNTCGSVDDGKSTLIGRLLYDSKSLMEDQLAALEKSVDLTGGGQINLANLTDGLRAEREQGITIDVAYRYFATRKRKFIIADTPGHVQYTRNMVTGASTANLSIVLVDARQGVSEQTRRHTFIAALLGIPHLVIAINKMDLVDWSEARYAEIRREVEGFLPKLNAFRDVKFIPLSALGGDNVVELSPRMPWYPGTALLAHLESVHIASDWNLGTLRFPVQWVNRPNNPADPQLHDFRGLSGQIVSGVVRPGQPVVVLPGGIKTSIKEIWTYDGPRAEAFCPQSVTLCLEHDLDVSRGDMIVGAENLPGLGTELQARICWMGQRPLHPGRKYLLKHGTQTVLAVAARIEGRYNMQSFDLVADAAELKMNDIGVVQLQTARPVAYDGYATNRATGSFILIEQGTNLTVGAGMLFPPTEAAKPEYTDFAI
ncbi:MAG TPA: GTP-binding protein [Verrucomicrobiota bacterium]|nr:GTP-binding protein [Verrucomicrobiota bacterium]HNT13984.1 GTP-binding protein [Verrucomicrobiota bacterium]